MRKNLAESKQFKDDQSKRHLHMIRIKSKKLERSLDSSKKGAPETPEEQEERK